MNAKKENICVVYLELRWYDTAGEVITYFRYNRMNKDMHSLWLKTDVRADKLYL